MASVYDDEFKLAVKKLHADLKKNGVPDSHMAFLQKMSHVFFGVPFEAAKATALNKNKVSLAKVKSVADATVNFNRVSSFTITSLIGTAQCELYHFDWHDDVLGDGSPIKTDFAHLSENCGYYVDVFNELVSRDFPERTPSALSVLQKRSFALSRLWASEKAPKDAKHFTLFLNKNSAYIIDPDKGLSTEVALWYFELLHAVSSVWQHTP